MHRILNVLKILWTGVIFCCSRGHSCFRQIPSTEAVKMNTKYIVSRLKPFMADCTVGYITPRLSCQQFTRHSATEATSPLDGIENAKPLSEMPGPRGVPYFGNLFLSLKNVGRFFEMFSENCRKYGPVHLITAPHISAVIVGDPDAAREFYHKAERFPARAPLIPWTYWKENRGKIPGILLRWAIFEITTYQACRNH